MGTDVLMIRPSGHLPTRAWGGRPCCKTPPRVSPSLLHTGEPWATESPSSARPAMSGAKCCRSWPSGTSRPMTSWRWPRRARRASRPRSARTTVLKVQDLAKFDFKGIDIVLSSPGAKVSAEHSPRAAKAGAVVIDNTSYWRMDPDVPLVVPEVNAAGDRGLQGARHHRQSQLLDHPDGGGAEADPRRRHASSASWSRPISRRRAPARKAWTSS